MYVEAIRMQFEWSGKDVQTSKLFEPQIFLSWKKIPIVVLIEMDDECN